MRIAVLVGIACAALLGGGLMLAGEPGTLGSVGVGLALTGIAGFGLLLIYSDATAARNRTR